MKIFGSGSVFPHDPADDVKSSGSTASGSSKFIINLSWHEEVSKYTVDKTYDEIVEAVKSGLDAQLVYRDGDVINVCNFVSWYGTEVGHMVIFSSICHAGDMSLNVTTYVVKHDNTVSEMCDVIDIPSNPK